MVMVMHKDITFVLFDLNVMVFVEVFISHLSQILYLLPETYFYID